MKIQVIKSYQSSLTLIILQPDRDVPFFLSSRGAPLGRIQHGSGTLLQKIGNVMGLPSLTVTMLRQAIESHIQANQDMRNIGRVLNNHSDAVGAFNYDKLNRKKRAEMVNHFEKQEIPTTSQDETKTDDEREKRKKEKRKDDEKARKKHAEEYLREQYEIRSSKRVYGKRLVVLPNQRMFLMKLIFKEVFNSIVQDFPHGKCLVY